MCLSIDHGKQYTCKEQRKIKKFMKNILDLKEAVDISKRLRKQHQKIVLVGGCFDILHVGHITLLEEAKKKGDMLFLLLESDETVKNRKGNNRPLQTQEERARVLSSLRFVDYVVLLPYRFTDKNYDDLVIGIKPAIIATTRGDPGRQHKERQASALGTSVVDVIELIPATSSSRLAKIVSKHFNV